MKQDHIFSALKVQKVGIGGGGGGGEGGGGDISSDVSSSAILGDALRWVTRLYLLYSGWPDKRYSGISDRRKKKYQTISTDIT